MFDKRETLKAKGIAICMLLFHHLFYSPLRIAAGGGITFHLLAQDKVTNIAVAMRLCVWVFAFLSAYGLTKQYEATRGSRFGVKHCIKFWWKHWFSTMLPYWLIFLLATLIAGFAYGDVLALYGGSRRALVYCAFGISDLMGTSMPVAAWWYMCLAQLLILILPLLIELSRKAGWWLLPGAVLLLPWLGAGVVSKFGGSYWNYLFVIILGVLCARYGVMEKLSPKGKPWWQRLIIGILLPFLVAVCTQINIAHASGDHWRFTKLFMALGAALVCLFSFNLPDKLIGQGLAFLGKYSGSIFLIHAFTYTFWLEETYRSHNAVLIFLSVLAVSLACAMLCQVPLSLIQKLMKKRTPLPAQTQQMK